MSFTSLFPRVATATVLLGLLGLALYFGHAWLCGLAFVFASLALWEFYSLFWPGRKELLLKSIGIALCGLLIAAGWAAAAASETLVWQGMALPALLGLSCMLVSVMFLIRYSVDEASTHLADNALVLFGLLYVVMPIWLALQLDAMQLVLLFSVTMAADTGAYFAGNFLGKHNVWPKVSPKKSVEGCVGGIIATMLVCVAFELCVGSNAIGSAIVVGGILAVAAMMGDFFESALKRVQGIKDSGHLLPGHGGVLDRLDSFLFVVPTYTIIELLLSMHR